MRVFVHTGGGFWVGSCVVVIAKNLQEAEGVVRDELIRMGLHDEELNVIDVGSCSTKEAKVLYTDNGDY